MLKFREALRAEPGQVLDVLIVGAGFAGLGTAIRLKQAGVHRFAILERSDRIGGTWRDNVYPGAACDIPSNLYSYSFAPNPEWSRSYSGSAEILQYIDGLVRDFELLSAIRFGENVVGVAFEESKGLWTATTAAGSTYTARALVMAAGPLSNASFPSMPGLASYEGRKIHSARWDPRYDFSGKRVAVIGTGASAVQIIPELVDKVASIKVFQRTPAWVLPRLDVRTPDWNKALFRKLPAAQSAVRKALFLGHESMALGIVWNTPLTQVVEQVARAHLRKQVRDPWLRRQLTPDYQIGCKRVLLSNDYYPALQRETCKLITWPIATLSPKGIRSVEGIEHQVDCIVFATGFDVLKTSTPFPVRGLADRTLDQDWAQGAAAYKSVSVAGYPNLFLTFGPNSGPGHNSALVYMESQIDYIVRGVTTILERDLRLLDVRRERQVAHNRELQRRLRKTNWNSGCKSWYLTENGHNASMYPGLATQFARQMRFDLTDYRAR